MKILTPSDRALQLLHTRLGVNAAVVTRAPGKVNLIGEHTDYNDGFVLPIATEQALWLALRARSDRTGRVITESHGEAGFDLDAVEKSGLGWIEYLKGVAWALGSGGLRGWDGALVSEIPVGAGLSSSAALEMATAMAFITASEGVWEPMTAARAGQRAENEWVGVSSGIMDQLAVAASEPGHATLID